jgi:endonuclease/exonuclease/phosphatase family metal-dependent hydrolase
VKRHLALFPRAFGTLAAAFLAGALPGCSHLPVAEDESVAEVQNLSRDRPPLPDSIHVLSWNIEGRAARENREHLANIAGVIRASGADVAMLQEIHRGTFAAGGRDQFAELVALTGMHGCFGKSLDVDGGAYGNAILSRAPLASALGVRLPGRGEPRTLLRCESQWAGLEVPLLTTHLTAWDRANRGPRSAQVSAITARLTARLHALVILGGDFNAPVRAPEMTPLRNGALLRPAFGSRVATHRAFGSSYDHLFVGSGWGVDGATVLHEGTSDHWPVRVKLRPLVGDLLGDRPGV